MPIDIALAAFPFEEEVVEGSSEYSFTPDITLRTCSAEDLIILKAFADRPQDWVDVEGVIVRQTARLDRKYILERLTTLCELKEAPEIVARAELMLQ